jgi:regulator of protease activity HflC (stomatin/prohibitin superfamily)
VELLPMPSPTLRREASREVRFPAASGWTVLVVLSLALVAVIAFGVWLGQRQVGLTDGEILAVVAFFVLSLLTLLVMLIGFFIVPPNKARVLVLFGRYRGTVRDDGFYWTNPFTQKQRISLKAHNVASKNIKVNDLIGNPIEIGAVVVWQVRDTAQAAFDVEDFTNYVDVQIETAVRHLASTHPYDETHADGATLSLRGSAEQLAAELTGELQQRLDRAGIEVLESRISHLAYAPEIASAMLQRQQAAAVIAARRLIVDGAVGMVEHALADLSGKGILQLDDERKAQLVGNLLVVLCSHNAPMPVLNTGSLYT